MNGHFSLCFCLQLQSLCIILFKSQAQSYEAAETIRGALGNFNSNPVNWSSLVKTGETQPLMAGLIGSYQLSWFYLSTELTASVFKYDTLCTSWPPFLQTVSNYSWTQTLPRDKGAVVNAWRDSRCLSGEHFISQAVMSSFVLALTLSIT